MSVFFFHVFLGLCLSSLEKYLFEPFAHFEEITLHDIISDVGLCEIFNDLIPGQLNRRKGPY